MSSECKVDILNAKMENSDICNKCCNIDITTLIVTYFDEIENLDKYFELKDVEVFYPYCRCCDIDISMDEKKYGELNDRCKPCSRKKPYEDALKEATCRGLIMVTSRDEWKNNRNKNRMTKEAKIRVQCPWIGCGKIWETNLEYIRANKTGFCKKCANIKPKSLEELIAAVAAMGYELSELTKQLWNGTTRSTTNEKIYIKCKNDECKNLRGPLNLCQVDGGNYCDSCGNKNKSINMKGKTIDKDGKTIVGFDSYEDESYKIIEPYLKDIIIKRTGPGCKTDLYVQLPKVKQDEWLAIQLKTSKQDSKEGYSFNLCNNKYVNMIVLCHHLGDNRLWIFDWIKDREMLEKSKINFSRNKCEENEVKHEDLANKIIKYYRSNILFEEEEIQNQLSETYLVERQHSNKREQLLKNKFDFYYPLKHKVYDLKINRYKVQDKAGQPSGKKFSFSIKRGKNRPYKLGDNDFYWLYNTYNSFFLVLPEWVLIKDRVVNGNQYGLGASFTVDFRDIKSNKYAEYIFDYDDLDINKLINMFE